MKTKTLILLMVTATVFSVSVHSQNVFGLKAGVQLTKITGFEDVPKSFLTTLQIKGVAMLPLTEEVTINPSLGYSGKGYRWNDLSFEDQMGNALGKGDAIGLFHYLQLAVPLSYKITAGQNHEYYLGAGPYFSYALSGKGRIKHVALSGDDDTWDLFRDNAYKRTDAGLVVDISGRLNKKYLIAFNADIGLADVNNSGGAKLKQLAAGISLGYLFNSK